MTEPMPVRKIEASQLRRANRPTPAQAPTTAPPVGETDGTTTPPDISQAAPAAVTAQRPPVQSTPTARPKETARMSTYLDAGVRDRARAAYKATAHLENDRSWSAFVEAALQAETIRREQIHNDGKPFPGGDQPLSPGRPID